MRLNVRALAALVPLVALPTVTPRVMPSATPDSVTVAPRVAGYAITMEMTSPGRPEKASMVLKFTPDKMRFEIDAASMGESNPQAAQMMNGMYMLAQSSGKIAMIMPSAGMGLTLDMAGMAAAFGGRGAAAQATCDAAASIEDLGAGETILGFATHKYRSRSARPASGSRPAGEEVTELWFATNMAGAEDAFRKFSESFGRQFAPGSGCPEVVAKMPKGFPMRVVTTEPGASGAQISRMDVTKVDKMDFAASDFEVPPGMQLMDGSMMMGGRGRGRGGE